jgi:hypothetical protein
MPASLVDEAVLERCRRFTKDGFLDVLEHLRGQIDGGPLPGHDITPT